VEERNALLNEIPGKLAARIGAIGLRHPPDQVKDLILALCRLKPWKSEELAALLNRKSETIRQDYLRPLLAQKQITMTIPDKPNSPLQAYRRRRLPTEHRRTAMARTESKSKTSTASTTPSAAPAGCPCSRRSSANPTPNHV
jgi:hypothetical protein